MKNKFRRETPAFEMSSVITLLCNRIDLTLGAAVTDMVNQTVLGVIGLITGEQESCDGFSCQGKVGVVTVMENRVKTVIRIVLFPKTYVIG